jgi:hypothetical protein
MFPVDFNSIEWTVVAWLVLSLCGGLVLATGFAFWPRRP